MLSIGSMTTLQHTEVFSEVIKRGSQSFAAASLIFPTQTRADMHRFYAWCRYCDDQIDQQILGHEESETMPFRWGQTMQISQLKESTAKALEGHKSQHLVFDGLSEINFGEITPKHEFDEFLRGMESDARGELPSTEQELFLYCYRVAGVVGVIASSIMGVATKTALTHAIELGMAMQLTNIARDLEEDSQRGRCYVPENALHEVHFENEQKLRAAQRRYLLIHAERFYESSKQGLSALDFRCRWAVVSALLIYQKIGKKIAKKNYFVNSRISTSKVEKMLLFIKAFFLAITIRSV